MTLVNLTGFQWGVELDETGINIETFEVTVRPEFKEFLKNKVGEKRGFAAGTPESAITYAGEISGATGVMAATFYTELALANDVDYFGQTTGGVFMDEATIRQNREGFKTLNASASRNAGIDIV